MRKTTKSNKRRIARNIAEAARMTGISRPTLTAYRKDGCPAIKPNGTVSLDELAEWMALHGKDAGKVPLDLAAARIRLLNAQAEKVERENKLRNDELADKREVREGLAGIMQLLFSELYKGFTQELPPDLKGRDEISIRARCTEEIDRLRDALRAKFEAILAAPDEPAESEGA